MDRAKSVLVAGPFGSLLQRIAARVPWSSSSNSERAQQALAWTALALATFPIALTLLLELAFADQRSALRGDLAVAELHLQQVLEGSHWLGAYSRFRWNHLGPLYYFALIPAYLASGRESSSLYLSAALVALVAGGAIMLLARARKTPQFAFLVAVAFGLFLADFVGARPLASPWNPIVAVLPFGVLWLLCWHICLGRAQVLPLAVFLHAFVVQTHLSHALTASALLATATVLGSRQLWLERSRGRRPSQTIYAAAAVAVVAWLPTVAAEFGGRGSNLAAVVRGMPSARAPYDRALLHGMQELYAPVLRLLQVPLDGWLANVLGALLFAAQLALLLHTARIAKQRRQVEFGCCLLGLVGLIAACVSCKYLGMGDLTRQSHLTLWFGLLGALNWLPVAHVLLVPNGFVQRSVFTGVAATATCFLFAWHGSLSVVSYYDSESEQSPQRAASLLRVAEALSPLFAGPPEARPVLTVGAGRPWPDLAGLVLALRKRGLEPLIDEQWRFMLGHGLDYGTVAAADRRQLTLATELMHDAKLVTSDGQLLLYAAVDGRQGATIPLSIAASAVLGNPELVIDGVVPQGGTRWNSDCAVRLTNLDSSLTLEHDTISVAAVEVSADGNDVYTLEGSADGTAFVPLAVVPSARAPGLRSRQVALDQPGPWRALRLSPASGDGLYSVAEFRPVPRVRPVRWQKLSGDVAWVNDGRTLPEGAKWSTEGALRFDGLESHLTFELPSRGVRTYVEGLQINADAGDEYAIDGSRDGQRFSRIGALKRKKQFGLTTRNFIFNDHRDWQFLRMAPLQGDGRFSVAEVTPIWGEGVLLDFGAPQSSSQLGPGWGKAGSGKRGAWREAKQPTVVVRTKLAPERDGLLTLLVEVPRESEALPMDVSVNGRVVASVALSAEVFEYTVELASSVMGEDNQFEFSRKDSGSAPWARFHGLLIRPPLADAFTSSPGEPKEPACDTPKGRVR